MMCPLCSFVDSVSDMVKYMRIHDDHSLHPTEQARLSVEMKMFRAQRNYYIAGVSGFLFV